MATDPEIEDWTIRHAQFGHGSPEDFDLNGNFIKPDDIDLKKRKQIIEEELKKIIFEMPVNKKREKNTKEFLRKKRLRKLAAKSKIRNRGR